MGKISPVNGFNERTNAAIEEVLQISRALSGMKSRYDMHSKLIGNEAETAHYRGEVVKLLRQLKNKTTILEERGYV